MPGTPQRLAGPAYIAASAANIYNPASNVYAVVRHIRVVNKTNTAATFSLYLGATGASAGGTEIAKQVTVPAYGDWDRYMALKMKTADFLTGLCETGASTCVITVDGDEFVLP